MESNSVYMAAQSSQPLREIIESYIVAQVGDKVPDFKDPALKVSDLGLDSLGVVEMLYEVEDRFGFQVEDPFRFTAMSFNDMVADMEATIRARNNGQLPELGASKGVSD